jgi:DNA-binding NarL/FixJ family response regulator
MGKERIYIQSIRTTSYVTILTIYFACPIVYTPVSVLVIQGKLYEMQSDGHSISVLVVDDQLVQREGIARVIESTGVMRVVGAVGSGEEALRVVKSAAIDLALVDLVLHEQSGTEVGRELRKFQPTLNVIIYTREKSMVLASEIFRVQKDSAQSGLQGYLLTRNISSSESLLQIYQQVLKFGQFIDPDILRWHFRFAELEPLTPREEECALLIARGLSNVQIADRMIVTRRRVENLINSLYLKFRIFGDPGDPARRVILAESIRLLSGIRSVNRVLGVVIVEDQEEQRVHLLTEFAQDKRFKVLAVATEGEEGVRLVCELKPDLVLVDVRLPDMDGFQVTRLILKNLPDIRVILNSAVASSVFQQQSIQSGAIAFLPKRQLTTEYIFELYYSPDE